MNNDIAKYIHPDSFQELTEAQRIAFDKLLLRNLTVITPFYNSCMGCLFGQIRFNETGIEMWFGIEPDGYTHT